MLTWMESHPLPFACTTNFGEHLDAATLRRFVFKVALDYLAPAQAEAAFRTYFGLSPPAEIAMLTALTPGDFAVVRRKAALLGRLAGAGCAGRHAERRMRRQAGPAPARRFRAVGKAVHGPCTGPRLPPSPARVSGADTCRAGRGECGALRAPEGHRDAGDSDAGPAGRHDGSRDPEPSSASAGVRPSACAIRSNGPSGRCRRWSATTTRTTGGCARTRSAASSPCLAEELAELGSAAETLERTGFEARAAVLQRVGHKAAGHPARGLAVADRSRH